MTDYKTIFGRKIKFLTSDLSAAEGEGEIFYSDTDSEFKIAVSTAAWSASAPLITARQSVGDAGTQAANLCIGGYVTAETTVTEEYNGTGWAAGGALPAAKNSGASFGTQTAAVYAAGGVPPNSTASNTTTEYDGSSWTAGNNVNTARDQVAGFGILTAGVAAGGTPDGSAVSNSTEEYDGTNWTAGNNLGTALRALNNAGAGVLTSGLLVSGGSAPAAVQTDVQEYDGTNWTAGTAIPAGKISIATSGTSQTAALAFGGHSGTAFLATSQEYDGSSWTSTPNMGTARDNIGGSPSGSTKAALVVGGRTPPISALTEEYNVTAVTITQGTWASGGNFPVTIQDACGAGPGTASVVTGGYDGPAYDNETFEYDGSTWTEGGNLNTARACYNIGTGSQTAALVAGGYATTAHTANSEEYDGSSWTEGGNLNNSRYSGTGGGVQTSALMCGGNGDPGNSAIANTESYNGSSWTNETALPVAKGTNKMFSGTSETSNIICGFGPAGNDTISYDGSSWTDLGHHLVDSKSNMAGGSAQGSTTSAIIAGGFDSSPGITAAAQQYNGSAWATAPSLSTSRYGGACSGTYSSCLGVGGEQPAQSNHTEEWTGETTAINLKTITDS